MQSYSGGTLEREGVDDSFTYDDALIIDALLARGEPEDLARAQVLGQLAAVRPGTRPRRGRAHQGRLCAHAARPRPPT